MKIIRVIVDEVPDKCCRCPLFDYEYGDCVALDECLYDTYSYLFPRDCKPNNCPLVKEEE